ncbi:glycosyltransferase [Microbacterium natoriense]
MTSQHENRLSNPSPAEIRVLHVVDRVSGGVPIAVATYIKNSPTNVENHVLSPFDAHGKPAAVWHSVDAHHHDLGSGLAARLRAVRRTSRSLRPAVVHSHSSFGGVYGRVSASRRQSMLVYTPHCFSFARTDLALLPRLVYRAVEWALGWRTDLVAACSPGEANLASSLSSIGHRVDVIPNVASVGAIRSWKRASANRPLRIGMLGRVSIQKDPHYFNDLVERLRQLDIAVEPVWIGDGPTAEVDKLRAAQIHVTGWLSGDDLRDQLCGLDVYVHSAAWEGFPLAVLDAHAVGLPILVRPIPAFGRLTKIQATDEGLADLATALTDDASFERWRTANRVAWTDSLSMNSATEQRNALSRIWNTE